MAETIIDGHRVFVDEEDLPLLNQLAAFVYNYAAKSLFGDFACLNELPNMN